MPSPIRRMLADGRVPGQRRPTGAAGERGILAAASRRDPMTTTPPPIRRSLPWLLAGLSMIGPFSIDAVFPAFPLIGARFGVDEVALQQLLSMYLLTYAVMSLFHG